jgi:xylitol oxidase
LSEQQQNWAGNITYSADRWHFPTRLDEVPDIVRRSTKIRALGTRHSFNRIADCTEDIVSMAACRQVLSLDRDRHTVTVEAGIRYGELGQVLQEAGYAVPNLASLPHISVAGACATATHGSGDRNGNLATTVRALELVTADGERVAFSREEDGETFAGAVVGLGALGVVTKLTLAIVPAFAIRQNVYENLPLAELEAHFEAIESSAYSVSLFTDWREARFNQVWLKQIVTDPDDFEPAPTFFGVAAAPGPRHPLDGMSAVNCTEQMGVPGPWHERLPHFRMNFMPSAGEELQSEYLLPRRHACAALRAVYSLRERIAPLLQISEIRTVAADDLWMSPCYQEACVGIHFTWLPDWPGVRSVLPEIETALAPFDARPHWGKLFTTPPDRLQALYSRLPDFRRLLQTYDPRGKFRNEFLDSLLFNPVR